MAKLLALSIVACFAVGYGIHRWITNRRNSNYAARLIQALDAAPALADEVAADYQNQYAKIANQGTKPLQDRLGFIQKGQKILEKYEVLGIYPLQNDGILIVTICRNKEIGESEGSTVIKNYVFNFVVRPVPATGEIEVCSDYYELLNDKLLRQDFAKYLAQRIV